MAGADSRSTKIPSTLPEEPYTLPKVLSTLLETVTPTSAWLTKGAEGHMKHIAKRETIKSWREIVTAKHETTISWHETKINMMKSKIDSN